MTEQATQWINERMALDISLQNYLRLSQQSF